MMHLSTVVVNRLFLLRELLSSAISLLFTCLGYQWASQVAQVVKNTAVSARGVRDVGSAPGLGRPPGGGHSPTLVFLPGDSHGQKSRAGYSPLGHKELDMTEQ